MVDVDVFVKARKLISNPENWCRGKDVFIKDDGVASYCSVGALVAVLQHNYVFPYTNELRKTLNTSEMHGITMFNDSHTHDDVLKLFDDTIARLKEQK